MMMMSFVAIGIVSMLWVLYGYSVAFGDTGNGFWAASTTSASASLIDKLAVNGALLPDPDAAPSRCSS